MGADLLAVIRPALRELQAAEHEEPGWCAEFTVGDEKSWIQVVADSVNLSYPFDNDPIERFKSLGIQLLPGMSCEAVKAGEYATLNLKGLEIDGTSRFVDSLLTLLYGFEDDCPLDVSIHKLK